MMTSATDAGTSKSVMDRHAQSMTASLKRYFCFTLKALTWDGKAIDVRLPSHFTMACATRALRAACRSIGIAF